MSRIARCAAAAGLAVVALTGCDSSEPYDPDRAAREFVEDLVGTGHLMTGTPAERSRMEEIGISMERSDDTVLYTQDKGRCAVTIEVASLVGDLTCGAKTFNGAEFEALRITAEN